MRLLIASVAITASDAARATTRLWSTRTGINYTSENTVEGLEYSLQIGASGSEFDIWKTGSSAAHPNGEIVLMHDRMVDRTTNYDELTGERNGDISELPFELLRTLDAGSDTESLFAPLAEFHQIFPGAKIPTMQEALLSLKANNADALIHFKGVVNGDHRSGAVTGADVAPILEEVDFPEGKAYTWAINHSQIQEIVANAPAVKVLYQGSVNSFDPDWGPLHALGVKGLQISSFHLGRVMANGERFLDALHAEGFESFIFLPSETAFISAVQNGVDIVMTHRVPLYAPILARMEQGDFDADKHFDGADLLLYQQGLSPNRLDPFEAANWESFFGVDWREEAGTSAAVPVPEPSMLIILLIFGLVAALLRCARLTRNPS